jgi:hypothetical protein
MHHTTSRPPYRPSLPPSLPPSEAYRRRDSEGRVRERAARREVEESGRVVTELQMEVTALLEAASRGSREREREREEVWQAQAERQAEVVARTHDTQVHHITSHYMLGEDVLVGVVLYHRVP